MSRRIGFRGKGYGKERAKTIAVKTAGKVYNEQKRKKR